MWISRLIVLEISCLGCINLILGFVCVMLNTSRQALLSCRSLRVVSCYFVVCSATTLSIAQIFFFFVLSLPIFPFSFLTPSLFSPVLVSVATPGLREDPALVIKRLQF